MSSLCQRGSGRLLGEQSMRWDPSAGGGDSRAGSEPPFISKLRTPGRQPEIRRLEGLEKEEVAR